MTSLWDNEKVLNFIKEYEIREILWKKDNIHYHNVIKKEEAWREISSIMNEHIDVLKKKMESLRGSRRREKNRMSKSVGTGKGRKNIYISNWFAWDSMQFLDDPEEIRGTMNNYFASDNEEPEEENDYDPAPIQNHKVDVNSGEEGNLQQDREATTEEDSRTNVIRRVEQKRVGKKFISPKKFAPRRRRIEDPRMEEAYNILKSKVGGEKKDECAIFGDYIAEKMRKLADKQRAILQHEIHSVVLQAEMATTMSQTSEQPVGPLISLPRPISSHHSSQTSSSHNSPLPPPLPLERCLSRLLHRIGKTKLRTERQIERCFF